MTEDVKKSRFRLVGGLEGFKVYAQRSLLETLLTGLAHFDALAPLGVEDLVGADASIGRWIEYAVNYIAAASLQMCQW